MAHPMGESKPGCLRVDFDRRLKLEFHRSQITSDGGLLAYRELDDALGLTEMAEGGFHDSRTGKNGWHGITGQFRQSGFGRLGGYDDVNDADRLGRDPAMRWVVGGKSIERQAASTSQMGRFETELLATDENVEALVDMNGVWIDKVHDRHPPKMIILDMDSSGSPTHGEQEGTAHNGHFGCTCYHPLFLFNQFGDLERCSLRPGNVHSADGWRNVLEPVVMRYKERKVRLYFRGDAAFASPEIYEYLEAEGLLYVIRLKANAILQRNIAHLLTRPVGRPPDHVRRFHASFSYQAGSWNKKRRVVAKVEWHPGELVPRVGFIVTNLSRPTKRVVAFYNHRGTAEQHIKEGKNAINWTRLSCRKFRNNAVRLQLHALAYNLGNFMRTLALPKEVEHCRASPRQRLSSARRHVAGIEPAPHLPDAVTAEIVSTVLARSSRSGPIQFRYVTERSYEASQETGATVPFLETSWVGVKPAPWASGDTQRDQGISRDGPAWIRAQLIQMTWSWLRYQPDSALSKWFNERTVGSRGRIRRVMIVALARKLLIALWRFSETGLVPTGAKLA